MAKQINGSQSYLYLAMALTFRLYFNGVAYVSQSYLYLAMALTPIKIKTGDNSDCRSPTST